MTTPPTAISISGPQIILTPQLLDSEIPMPHKVRKQRTYDYDNRSRGGSGPRSRDENIESPMSKKIEELQRASGEIKYAECRHIFESDEIFGMQQCPECCRVFCSTNCLVIHAAGGSHNRSKYVR